MRALKGESVGAVRAVLNGIYRKKKELKASVVVAEATAKDSPIHDFFEWDNKKAGHEYRLQQARRLIRICMVESVPGEVSDPFVHVPAENSAKNPEGAYHPMSVVVENVDWYARALEELTKKVRAATLAAEDLRRAAQSTESTDKERLARIGLAITALETAGAAVQALH